MVVVVDAGTGNLRSLTNALARLGFAAEVAKVPPAALPETLILPGVGAFGHVAAALGAGGWMDFIPDAVRHGCRLIGICLGMQLLFERSEESPGVCGLGLLKGDVVRLDAADAKVPHIGWSRLRFTRPCPQEGGLPWAYFVHSYTVRPAGDSVVSGWARHGEREFPASVAADNVVGVQFHPEKSQGPGLAFLANLIAGAA
ncbi:MAG: imidazole glycerol phosphate synthase subunit HisH [Thermoanaerobaculales bacterium]